MRQDLALRLAVAGMAFALALMLVCLASPSSRTSGLFLGVGLPVAAASAIVFALYVLRDLRRRRAL